MAAVTQGVKDDGGKPRWWLLPLDALTPVVRVLGFGADKYEPNNWRKVPQPQERYFSAAMRHLAAHQAGEWLDDESKLPHLAHAVCCLLFMLALHVQRDATAAPPAVASRVCVSCGSKGAKSVSVPCCAQCKRTVLGWVEDSPFAQGDTPAA